MRTNDNAPMLHDDMSDDEIQELLERGLAKAWFTIQDGAPVIMILPAGEEPPRPMLFSRS